VYAQALSKLNDAVKAVKGKSAKAPDDVTSATSDAGDSLKDVKTTYKKATDSLGSLSRVTDAGKLKAAQSDVSSAVSDYKTAVGKYQEAEDSLGTALVAWNSAASSDDSTKTKNDQSPQADGGSPGPSPTVANDVALIVQTIVWQSFVTEQCERAMFQKFETTALPMQKFCLDHLIEADKVRRQQLLQTLPVSNTLEPGTAGTPKPLAPLPTPVVQPPPLFSLHDQALFETAVSDIVRKQTAAQSIFVPAPAVPASAPPASPPGAPAPQPK
jgi:hypothetical protein